LATARLAAQRTCHDSGDSWLPRRRLIRSRPCGPRCQVWVQCPEHRGFGASAGFGVAQELGDGDSALELLSVNAYDIAVLDRDIAGPSGDEIAESIVASDSGLPVLMLTAADRLDDKASGFGLGADDYLTKPFELREFVLRLRALDRRRGRSRPPVREVAGLRLDPFRREVYRDGVTVPELALSGFRADKGTGRDAVRPLEPAAEVGLVGEASGCSRVVGCGAGG